MLNNTKQGFYRGQLITEDHLNDLQTYSDINNTIVIQDLFGYGIGHGLEIAHNQDDCNITISSGIAFHNTGDRLILEEGKSINLESAKPTDAVINKTLLLGLQKKEIVLESATDILGNTVSTKIQDGVDFVYGETLERNVFILAEIVLSSTGIISTKIIAPKITTFKYPQRIRDLVYPIGTFYTQYPNHANGVFEDSTTPTTLFGGTWELQFSDKSVFFRTEGGRANESRNESTGIQNFFTENHYHNTNIGGHDHHIDRHRVKTDASGSGSRYRDLDVSNAHWKDLGYKPSDGVVTYNNTETRPINMLIRIWQRIA